MALAFEVKHLKFTYPSSKKTTLDDISFSVEQGKIFGLLGPSGAGKSTTQKILTKLLTDYSGEVLYFGKEIKTLDRSFYERIGVGFEAPVHFNKLTGNENLAYFSSFYKTKTDYAALMTRVGLADAGNQAVGEYSKGMKVRLNFVRALLNDPDFIFLDEPTNGLDPTNAHIIKEIIKELREKGKTIFISTHLMGDVEQLCDQVAFINHGHISEIASPQALKLKYGKHEVTVEYANHGTSEKRVFDIANLGTNQAFLDTLKKEQIITIHSGETTMEDIFMKVTGEMHE
ncbi:MAG: ABC transporter ATP-binding protein [Firmicutes bacterium]|nr:ABC transporter ATP-binding protein [Bacillota bacterium]